MAPQKLRQQRSSIEYGPLRSLSCSSLEEVAYRGKTIRVPMASATLQQIFLDRLYKEILGPSRKKLRNGDEMEWTTTRQRFLLGTNVCTRVLEKDDPHVKLIVLASDCVHLSLHIPLLCHANDNKTPLLLLPADKSKELGKLFRIRRVACMAITSSTTSLGTNDDDPLDSFLNFILTKM